MSRWTIAVGLALALALASGAAAQDGDDPGARRAESARKAYMDASKSLSAGLGGAEPVYRWSLRWLDARLAVDPGVASESLAAHRDRMEGLRTNGRAMIDAGAIPAGTRHALDYYVAEAELWVARGERGPGS